MSAPRPPCSRLRTPLTELTFTSEFLLRAGLVAICATVAHLLEWNWLRFATSEAVLRLSSLLGMTTARLSFDTILVHGALFRFVVACTFVDVCLGSFPLFWDLAKSLRRNLLRLSAVAVILAGFNLLRLEFGQMLYAQGMSWTLVDNAVGGFAYFAVWLAIWRLRTWEVFERIERLDFEKAKRF